ncbi:MAG: hypothetical protein SPK75_07510 [Victivallales bacterium]|nr:hypothetical protein [bacterium]MDD7751256.1 hypothetical protein [bacterium]MDY5696203.1 hypothetical protein [Victivallales bacterium]
MNRKLSPAAEFILPVDVPFPLNFAHETLNRLAASFVGLRAKIRNRLKNLTGEK